MNERNDLASAFGQRRAELRRYFVARVGDADADDLVQEVWLRISRVGSEAQPYAPVAYLHRIASNVMLDRVRSDRSRMRRDADWYAVTHTLSAAGDEISDAPAADRSLIARERLAGINAALTELPDAVQRTFRLHKLEGLTHGEAAQRLGISRSLVEKHMMRALKHLMARAAA